MSNFLPDLLGALPEVYQPIFGHPELSGVVSRGCEDRLLPIVQVYQSLESQLNRPLRVLDLGCAQGFFSLSLAKLGAKVHGVDFFGPNIDVCRALAGEYSEWNISFELGRIENCLAQLVPNQYDLALGLSVFHHIVHIAGTSVVQQMLGKLACKVAAGIFELALANEPLYWGPSQPQDPRLLLDGFTFVHELARHGTHLSTIARPMYIASNRYWFLDGQAGLIDTWQDESHALAGGSHQGTRRYFFGGGLCIKLFRLDRAERAELNLHEHNNEMVFLSSPPPGFSAPQLFLHGKNDNEAWLVRQQLSGELLLDIMRAGKPYDADRILQDVLAQLVAMEAVGLYHNDIRTWNILLGPDGQANLIDFGAITKNKTDCVWPGDIFQAFFIFVHEIQTGKIESSAPPRMITASVDWFEPSFSKWVLAFWSTPVDKWSFALMQRLFVQPNDDKEIGDSNVARPLDAANVRAQQAEVGYRQAEAKALQAEARASEIEAKAQQAKAELNAIYNSRSWRIASPLRWCGRQARLMHQHGMTLRLKALVKRIVSSLLRR